MSARSRRVWGLGAALAGFAAIAVTADPLPPSATYRPLPTLPFDVVKVNDEAEKPRVILSPDHNDAINYDIPPDKISASGYGHPQFGGRGAQVAEQIHFGFVPKWARVTQK